MGGEEPAMDGGSDTSSMGGGEPMMGDDINSSPMGGEEPSMGGDSMETEEPLTNDIDDSSTDDSTMSIINKLSSEDREAVRSYAESMLSRSEESLDEPQNNVDEPMMESVIFTKRQLKTIMENFGPTEDEFQKNKSKNLDKKHTKSVSKNSPFNSPKFN